VAEDLGTWPAEQATVLLEVLQKAGLSPEAKRTREGIAVSVPDDQGDEAHRTLVANMDTIAQAARPAGTPRQRRAARESAGTKRGPRTAAGGAPMPTERLQRLVRPLGLLIVGLLLLTFVRSPLVIVVAIAVLVYVLGKQAQQRGDGGDDRRRF
jgi:hypothetical protein